MKRNIGSIDGAARFMVGTGLAVWAFSGGPVWSWIGVAIAGIGLYGWCPLYAALGLGTCHECEEDECCSVDDSETCCSSKPKDDGCCKAEEPEESSEEDECCAEVEAPCDSKEKECCKNDPEEENCKCKE